MNAKFDPVVVPETPRAPGVLCKGVRKRESAVLMQSSMHHGRYRADAQAAAPLVAKGGTSTERAFLLQRNYMSPTWWRVTLLNSSNGSFNSPFGVARPESIGTPFILEAGVPPISTLALSLTLRKFTVSVPARP